MKPLATILRDVRQRLSPNEKLTENRYVDAEADASRICLGRPLPQKK